MNNKVDILSQDKISHLERMLSTTNMQLKAENKRCDDLQQQLSMLIQDKLNLEKRLTEMDCEYAATKKELDQLSKENHCLSDKNYDLEIALAEGDVYDQIVKENTDKLENLCATLREQRDEQNTYHMQKVSSLKNELERKLNKLKDEKAEAVKNLTDMKLETVSSKDELKHYHEAECEWKKEKAKMAKDIENLSMHIQVLEKDLNMEKESVSMLSLKNNNLSASLMEVDKTRQISSPVSKGTVSMIEELVNKFYEKKLQAATDFNTLVVDDLKKQLSECEAALSLESQARLQLESQLDATVAELSRVKANDDSLFELSVSRTRNNLNRCQNLKLSPRQTKEVSLTHLNPLISTPNLTFLEPTSRTSHPIKRTTRKSLHEFSDNDENAATAADSIFTNVSANESFLLD